MTLCQVCTNQDHKYNPKCFVFYCSVLCFKEHKCEQVEQTSFKVDAAPDSEDLVEERSYLHEIPEDYKIPNEVLERLKYSEEVKSLLTNENLQKFLTFAHETYNPSGFVRIAMREPLFIEFADACLRTINPEDYPNSQEPTDEQIIDFVKNKLTAEADE